MMIHVSFCEEILLRLKYFKSQTNAQFVSHNYITLKHQKLKTPTFFYPCRIITGEQTHQIIMYIKLGMKQHVIYIFIPVPCILYYLQFHQAITQLYQTQ